MAFSLYLWDLMGFHGNLWIFVVFHDLLICFFDGCIGTGIDNTSLTMWRWNAGIFSDRPCWRVT